MDSQQQYEGPAVTEPKQRLINFKQIKCKVHLQKGIYCYLLKVFCGILEKLYSCIQMNLEFRLWQHKMYNSKVSGTLLVALQVVGFNLHLSFLILSDVWQLLPANRYFQSNVFYNLLYHLKIMPLFAHIHLHCISIAGTIRLELFWPLEGNAGHVFWFCFVSLLHFYWIIRDSMNHQTVRVISKANPLHQKKNNPNKWRDIIYILWQMECIS